MSSKDFWHEQEFQCDFEENFEETSSLSCPLAINRPSKITCVRNSNIEKFNSASARVSQ